MPQHTYVWPFGRSTDLGEPLKTMVGAASPAELVAAFEANPELPAGSGERFAGYGVMSCPFASGHILALRRFPATSAGPGYTSVWHRDPEGRWVFYQDQPATGGCSHYFGPALDDTIGCAIDVEWVGARRLAVTVAAEPALDWEMVLAGTTTTRLLNRIGTLVPRAWWTSPAVLTVMGKVAASTLRAGTIRLRGTAPNGQRFVANPRRLWTISTARARMGDEDFGPLGPCGSQAHLGDFWIPTRGLFAIGDAFFEPARTLSTRKE